LHGLATPGFIVEQGDVVGVAAQLAVVALVGWMAAAAFRRPRDEGRALRRVLVIWMAVLVAVVATGLAWPSLFRLIPVDQDPLRWGVSAVVLAAALVAGLRFAEGYRLSRSGLHLVMLYVVALLVASQLVMALGETFRLSWWLYHLFLLIAVVAMLAVVAHQLQSGRLDDGLRALLDDDAERRLAYGLRPEVRALVVATEAKDPYTAGHMQRVAALAMRLGRALGLDAEDLRALGQAGVIHDVGKIEVPDAILNKPGRLDSDEFARVQEHPVAGERIGRQLGLHRRELEIVRFHHERWDGGGYPDGLAGEAIPYLARVLAVADVYDALTSDRAYRSAMAPDEAIRLVEGDAGTAFDPSFVRPLRAAVAAASASRAGPDVRLGTARA
jgi:HD-GYP domain-containing protein (c-di-GMP phosphodiesterase class II)